MADESIEDEIWPDLGESLSLMASDEERVRSARRMLKRSLLTLLNTASEAANTLPDPGPYLRLARAAEALLHLVPPDSVADEGVAVQLDHAFAQLLKKRGVLPRAPLGESYLGQDGLAGAKRLYLEHVRDEVLLDPASRKPVVKPRQRAEGRYPSASALEAANPDANERAQARDIAAGILDFWFTNLRMRTFVPNQRLDLRHLMELCQPLEDRIARLLVLGRATAENLAWAALDLMGAKPAKKSEFFGAKLVESIPNIGPAAPSELTKAE